MTKDRFWLFRFIFDMLGAGEVNDMEVSSKQVLNKIEDLVGKAKQANSEEKLKGYIFAIQALCELMTNDESSTSTPSFSVNHSVKPVTTVQTLTNVAVSKPVPMDHANGDSIFDF